MYTEEEDQRKLTLFGILVGAAVQKEIEALRDAAERRRIPFAMAIAVSPTEIRAFDPVSGHAYKVTVEIDKETQEKLRE